MLNKNITVHKRREILSGFRCKNLFTRFSSDKKNVALTFYFTEFSMFIMCVTSCFRSSVLKVIVFFSQNYFENIIVITFKKSINTRNRNKIVVFSTYIRFIYHLIIPNIFWSNISRKQIATLIVSLEAILLLACSRGFMLCVSLLALLSGFMWYNPHTSRRSNMVLYDICVFTHPALGNLCWTIPTLLVEVT